MPFLLVALLTAALDPDTPTLHQPFHDKHKRPTVETVRKLHRPDNPDHYLHLASGLRQRTVLGGQLGQLVWSNGHLAELVVDRAPQWMWSIDPQTLQQVEGSRPGDAPDQPGALRRTAVPVRGGWIIAKAEGSSLWNSIQFFRADSNANVFRVTPVGETPHPSPEVTPNGTTYHPSEGLKGDATFLFFTEGPPRRDLLVGFCLKIPKSKPEEHRLSLAIVDEDGHVKGAPVVHDWHMECAWPAAATWLGNAYLVAQLIALPTMGGYFDKEEIRIVRISPDLKAETVNQWQVAKGSSTTWGAYVQKMLWAKEGDAAYLVYGGGLGSAAVRIGADGKRIGEPFVITVPEQQRTKNRAGPLVSADLHRGHLRVLVNDPARLLDFDVQEPSRFSMPISFSIGPEVFSAAFVGERVFLEWARRHDLPPLYLTVVSP